jgi:hypothetical protein
MSDGARPEGIVRPCSLTYVAHARSLGCLCRAAGYSKTNHQSGSGRGPRNPNRRLQDKGRDVRGDGRGETGRQINVLTRGAANGRSLRDATTHCTNNTSRDVRAPGT